MNHYLLIYDLADDYLARRSEFRGVHLNLVEVSPEAPITQSEEEA